MAVDKNKKQLILVISNDEQLHKEIPRLSKNLPLKINIQRGSYEALQMLRLTPANLVILDYNMPLIAGEELIRLVHKAHSDTPIIAVIDAALIPEKKKIIDAGAIDFMVRPIDSEEIKAKIENLMFMKSYHLHVAKLRDKLKKEYGLENIIGDCETMWKVFRLMGNISKSDVTVFISGESGTGKELLAKAIHRNSRRRNNSLITINCAAIPENLLESELFGHEKGAFSGAISTRIGKFEMADKGTVFLDEIGEMSLFLQAKILRILEEQEFERVGGNKTIKIDVRIISATNKNLDEEVKAGRFRKDLYYRTNVYPIFLPPLRERVDDIPLLVYHFLDVLSRKNSKEVLSISPAALKMLTAYQWLGNIRELENVIERALLNCPGKIISAEDLDLAEITENEKAVSGEIEDYTRLYPYEIDSKNAGKSAEIDYKYNDTKIMPLKIVEKIAIERTLNSNNGNISASAQQLQIGRATLHRKIK